MPAGSLNLVARGTGRLRGKPSLSRYKSVHMRRNRRKTNRFNRNIGTNAFNVSRAFQRGPNPFPREYFAKLHYSHWSGLAAPGGGVAGGINFRLNSLFDPDSTGVGHQPYQFDQLVPVYKKAKVYGCLVEIEWSNPSVDGYIGGISLLGPSMTGASGKAIDYIAELPNTRMITLNNTGSQVKRQRVYVDLAKLNGVTRNTLMADPAYEEATAGPAIAKQNYLQLFAIEPGGGTPTCSFKLRLTYYVKMYGYADPGQS